MVKLGVVVIGRNEGARLKKSLESMRLQKCPVIYVDSGSEDDSLIIANELADQVLALDPTTPFSAARARNEGFEKLVSSYPSTMFVQFVDGDCVLSSGWLDAAQAVMLERPEIAVVVGHLAEANESTSVYNKMCALEWKSPVGDMKNFGALGGISMVRAEVFKELSGFNTKVIAGEDSEFGVRLSLKGYHITKIDHPMATHDAGMTRFQQWWKRAVRAGHAIGQRADLNGNTLAQDCVRERRSTWIWGICLPLTIMILAIPTKGFSLLLLTTYVLLALRIFKFRRRLGDSPKDAKIYTYFTVLGKFANGLGLVKFYLNKVKSQYNIIEYK